MQYMDGACAKKNATSCWLKQDTHTHSDTHTHIMHACPYASPANQHHWFYPQSLMAQFPFTVNLAFSRLSNGIRLLISNRGAPKFASSGSTQPQWQGKSNPHTSALEGAHSCDCWLLDLALQPLLTVQFDQNIFCSTLANFLSKPWTNIDILLPNQDRKSAR